MLLSMTGYGNGEARLGGSRLVIELRAVNHRFLDVRVRLPAELSDVAGLAEEIARQRLERGRVDVAGRLERDEARGSVLDRETARRVFTELCALRDEIAPGEPVPLSLLAAVPNLFIGPSSLPRVELERAMREAMEAACGALGAMRLEEGDALGRDLRERVTVFAARVAAIRARAPTVVQAHRAKLRERIERLLAGTGVELDESRLEHEIVFFADRAEITEELTRLDSHGSQLGQLLGQAEGAVGKRIEFLLQEMNREINTIGSKSSDAAIAGFVIEAKAELERIRQQAHNLL